MDCDAPFVHPWSFAPRATEFRGGRRSILSRYAASVEDRIGEGDEAEVYALGAGGIIEIFKPGCDPETIERRRAFYDMVDVQGCIAGVVDYSGLTLSGDPRLDAAASVLHLTGLDGIAASDQQLVLALLRDHGLTDDDLALYRLFHAFRFLDTPRAGLLRWCLDTIRAAG